MTNLTVDDLARDLKVKNEDLVRELVIMGFRVEGPESPLETDDPVALRAQLVTVLPQREVVEQRIKPTVIRRRMKQQPVPEEQQELAEPSADVVEESTPPVEAKPEVVEKEADRLKIAAKKSSKKAARPEAARIIEMAPKPVAKPAKVHPVRQPEVVRKPVVVSEKEAAPKSVRDKEVAEIKVAAPPAPPTERLAKVSEAQPREAAPGKEEMPSEIAVEAKTKALVEEAPLEKVPEAETSVPSEEKRLEEERPARKKKKKEKRIQPAQIIGRVELRKEPVKEPEAPEPERAPRVARPAVVESREHVPQVLPLELTEEEELKRKKKKEKKGREIVEERVEEGRTGIRRRKEVLLRDELYDDRPRGGRLRGKGKKPKVRKTEITTPKAIKRRIKLPEMITVASLAHRMSIKASEVIQHLLTLGATATVNEAIDFDTATIVASEFGFETETSERSEGEILQVDMQASHENLSPRSPVVTVMGHVDHGKTSLLDAIRSTHVTEQEAGGITQHIGAYKVKTDRGELVFLDTPGHEAFTAMRARGAQVTDFVVLVVAADDGVMEQTKEAINHSRAANVPIIVAVNKIDKPEADKDRVIRDLSEYNLIPEAWGGDTLFCYVSAKTLEGIDELLDLILLQAEMMELKANPNKTAMGTIIEGRLDKGKGPVGTILVREGTLKLGDPFIAGIHYGKVRSMLDHEGRSVSEAGPATPVEVQGFSGVPDAGESFLVVEEERLARQVSVQRLEKQRVHEAAAIGPVSLEDLMARMQEQETRELNLIIKADVQGSVEALKESLLGISAQEIKVKVIHSGVGGITESDVMLASASGAIIIGFNVRPSPKATQLAEQEKIDLRLYTVIYEVIEDVRKAMEGMLAPIEKEAILGRAEVRQIFHVPKIGTIAGCYVASGKIERSNQVRLIRDDVVVYQGKITSMKRFKDDIKEAVEGYECGIALENYKDVKTGDIVEAFTIEREAAKLT
ncbi:MAG TPA: translation initiation factor IF-2 [Desulfomonilaceae bacterium]|nr:translation initiation factor IF-2 [Desulfomonilaceae bacterium]